MAARASEIRLRVAAVVVQGDGLLLVRHERNGRGYVLLPGGGVEVGESLADAVTREVREETGLEVRVSRPLFISDSIDPGGERHMVQITFLAEVTGGSIAPVPADPAVRAIEMVRFADLERTDLRPPMQRELITAATAHFAVDTTYLGPLWSDETPTNGTDRIPATDG